MSTNDTANRTIREYIKPYLDQHDYVAEKVERTSKHAMEKDIYSEGDIVAVPIRRRDRPVLLVQAKTNTPATQKNMRQCAKAYAGPCLAVLCITHIRNSGPQKGTGLRVQRYYRDGSMDEEDLRVEHTFSEEKRAKQDELERNTSPLCL